MYNPKPKFEQLNPTLRSAHEEATVYEWVVRKPGTYEWTHKGQIHKVTVPKNFLSDGATCAPDLGSSWLVHDWLYATHRFDGGGKCTRKQADRIFKQIIEKEFNVVFAEIGNAAARLFGAVHWHNSKKRGPEFLHKMKCAKCQTSAAYVGLKHERRAMQCPNQSCKATIEPAGSSRK